MDYREAIAYIEKVRQASGVHLSLDQVAGLAERVGRPDRRLCAVHIAGTNGKGSVGAYIAGGLAMAGYTVGRYISPAVFGYREKIQRIAGTPRGMDEEWISEEDVAAWMTVLSCEADRMEAAGQGRPTAFEIETVMAFCQMLSWRVDVAVIEAGMGGALDATNIIERPELVVLTGISSDHTVYLGSTLKEIASQKFGIIKEGIPVVSVRQEPVVQEMLETICKRRGLKLRIADPGQIRQQEFSLEGTRFSYRGYPLALGQAGCYQPENAVTALEALWQLEEDGFDRIRMDAVERAFLQIRWRGRFDCISTDPMVILDGAHNPAGAAALRRSLEMYFPEEHFTFLFGVFRDKDYKSILTLMIPLAARFYTVKAAGPRGMDPEELARIVREQTGQAGREIAVMSCPDAVAALRLAGRYEEKTVAFGSLSFFTRIFP